MINVRRWSRTGRLAALLAALLTVTLGPVLAQPASATPVCTGVTNITHGSLTFAMASNGGSLDCHMQTTSTGAAVRNLQQDLNLCYWTGSLARGHIGVFGTRLAEDGDFGGHTADALRAVQSRYSIQADGVYGPETRRTINFFADDDTVGRCAKFGA